MVSSQTLSRKDATPLKERAWTAGFLLTGALLLLALWLRPSEPPAPRLPHLQAVLESGVLRVATVNSPLTYYYVQDEPRGFEYELALSFAEQLGVELDVIRVGRFQDLFASVNDGTADLAAASITVTDERSEMVRFGPTYHNVTQEVVYRSGSSRPRRAADLVGRDITVVSGSSYAETLRALQQQYPELTWQEQDVGDIESLFAAINEGELELTVADSNILAVHRRFYPMLRAGFSLTEAQPIAWAFPNGDDESLIQAAGEHFSRLTEAGRLTDLRQQHFAHVATYNRINTHYFLRHIRDRLPGIQDFFEEAAEETGFDWKLLAAIGYQESHWRSDAVSPTGVRGLMMLTQATARQMGVDDRLDPFQSIIGGARYLARVKRKIPKRIREPDRTWLALAAYNVGFGHLEDARILTQRRGGDPDKWADVEKSLPLLSDRNFYVTLRYGYARGREPVTYVRNIRSYYDILIWRLEDQDGSADRTAPP